MRYTLLCEEAYLHEACAVKDLFAKASNYLPEDRVAFVQKAHDFAARAHQGQKRLSGEPFIRHPVETASHLADLRVDATTLAAALLHDVVEDCGVTYDELEREFGHEVASLVDGVTKLSRLELLSAESRDGAQRSSSDGHDQAANLRKMLVAMAQDLRVVLIKLADRLHNMRTLKAQPPERRLAIAQETLDIYAPLAHRLGMWDFKWRLEDLAFRYLQPARYREISRLLATRRDEREQYITRVLGTLSQALKEAEIKAEVAGRAKHIYSIHRKAQAYAAQGKDFHDIHDLFALRVLVKEKQDCYAALGVVHSLWAPLPGQFDDYVGKPKANMYQALHTTVMGSGGMPLEVQIKTHTMHQLAEYGVAAHWRYKEGQTDDTPFERKMTWLRQLLDWQREVSGAEEFLESVKTDIFPDQVFVYTPKGDIKELPAGSSPIDFAYRVHTDLGHRCIGAKVNGKLVPLDYQLQNGDTVEILTSKVARGPSLDWLNPHAGYVRTVTARQRIRAWFRRQERGESIKQGREVLVRELRRLNLHRSEEDVARLFRMDPVDDFLAALGNGAITTNQVVGRLTQQPEEPAVEEYQAPTTLPASGIEVLGVGDLLTRLAQCCSPLPGDAILGFITRSRGITIHKKDCRNILTEDEPERFIPVNWGVTKHLHPVRLSIESWDRVGLLRDITTLVSAEKVNIASMLTRENDEGTATIQLTLFTTGVEQLTRLFAKLEEVQGVISVTRAPLSQAAKPLETTERR
ncbi:MAG: bifunctional (p)ppGpp synthetase/guanosine-3',5'-bis(diphosphate) 3'-pyrophosphohydrolase [Chloroflexi bacterium]|nr:bifunctional (p)ppGpp synthetase/guanosine-3',5'-bis(diphosphate) 3'-pyrophosphohydrolase [Chloroflexota bacterium]